MNDGGPAFPITDPEGVNWIIEQGYTGMTLRDYFACHAPPMPKGMRESAERAAQERGHEPPDKWQGTFLYLVAKWNYRFADAMLRARQRYDEPTAHDQPEPGNSP